MSRTYHHSYKFGKSNAWAIRYDRGGYGTTPSWFITMFMNRPGRRDDRRVINLIMSEQVDPDEAVFERTGGRKPHEYYW